MAQIYLYMVIVTPMVFADMGMFISLTTPCKDWTPAQWVESFENMTRIDVRTVVVQETVYNDVAYFSNSLGYKYWGNDPIPKILNAAAQINATVYLGLINDHNTWFSNTTASYHKKLALNSCVLSRELYLQYGTHASFGGWYIPQEIDNLRWQSKPMYRRLTSFIQQVVSCLTGTIIISPFFNSSIVRGEPPMYACLWNRILRTIRNNINIHKLHVILQDGASAFKHGPSVILQYMCAIRDICSQYAFCVFSALIEVRGLKVDVVLNNIHTVKSCTENQYVYEYSAFIGMYDDYVHMSCL